MLYYYLTAHPDFGEKSKQYLMTYSGTLATSSLTVRLLHVLTCIENISSILDEIGVDITPLDSDILREAE